jgi:hypothetical protein
VPALNVGAETRANVDPEDASDCAGRCTNGATHDGAERTGGIPAPRSTVRCSRERSLSLSGKGSKRYRNDGHHVTNSHVAFLWIAPFLAE